MSTDFFSLKPPITSLSLITGNSLALMLWINEHLVGTLCVKTEDQQFDLIKCFTSNSIVLRRVGVGHNKVEIRIQGSYNPDPNMQVISEYGEIFTVKDILSQDWRSPKC